METAAQVLLIIVSSVLSIFLIVSIIALVYIIKVLKQVKRITEQAENVVDSVEAAADTFRKAASPIALFKILGSIVENAAKFNRKGKK